MEAINLLSQEQVQDELKQKNSPDVLKEQDFASLSLEQQKKVVLDKLGKITGTGDWNAIITEAKMKAFEGEDKPLDYPVISPELALGAGISGFGRGYQAFNTAQGALATSTAAMAGSVAGDIGADVAIKGMDWLLSEDFKKEHNIISGALNMGAALAGGYTAGTRVEKNLMQQAGRPAAVDDITQSLDNLVNDTEGLLNGATKADYVPNWTMKEHTYPIVKYDEGVHATVIETEPMQLLGWNKQTEPIKQLVFKDVIYQGADGWKQPIGQRMQAALDASYAKYGSKAVHDIGGDKISTSILPSRVDNINMAKQEANAIVDVEEMLIKTSGHTGLNSLMNNTEVASNQAIKDLVNSGKHDEAYLQAASIVSKQAVNSTAMAHSGAEIGAGALGFAIGGQEDGGTFNIEKAMGTALIFAGATYGIRKTTPALQKYLSEATSTPTATKETVDGVAQEDTKLPSVSNKLFKLAEKDFNNIKGHYETKLVSLQEQLEKRLASITDEKIVASIQSKIDEIKDIRTALGKYNTVVDLQNVVKTNKRLADYLNQQTRPVVTVGDNVVDELAKGLQEGKFTNSKNIQINTARLQTEDDVKSLMEAVETKAAEAINKAGREKVTFEQTQEMADAMNISMGDLNKVYADTSKLSAKLLAARMVTVNLQEEVVAMAKQIKEMEAGLIPAVDLDRLKLETAHKMFVAASVQAQVAGIKGEVARTLGAMRISAAGTKTLKPEDTRKVLEALGDKNFNDALEQFLKGDERIRNNVAHKLTNPKWTEVISEIYINNLLSSPPTHAVNMISNSITTVDALFENMVKAESMGEAKTIFFSFFQGIKEGLNLSSKVWKEQRPYLDGLSKLEYSKALTDSYLQNVGDGTKGFINWLGNAVRTPTRLLTAEDEFFKAISYRMTVNKLAYRQALEEGLQGTALHERVAKLADDVDTMLEAKRLMSDKTVLNKDEFAILQRQLGFTEEQLAQAEKMYEAGIVDARYRTFQQDLGEYGQKVQGALAHPVLRFIAPFVKTPINIAKYTLERIPGLPLIKAAVSNDYRQALKNPEKMKELFYRQFMGLVTMSSAYGLAEKGFITGGSTKIPVDGTKEDAGWQPYSFKVGTTYISYNRFDPLGMMIGAVADLYRSNSTPDNPNTKKPEDTSILMSSLVNQFMNKTWLTGFSNIVQALTYNSPDALTKVGAFTASSFVPTLLTHVNQTFVDPTVREYWEFADAFKAKIPGLSQTLEPKITTFGKEKQQPFKLSPFKVTKEDAEMLGKEIIRLNINLSPLDKYLDNGVKLTPEQYVIYAKTTGELFSDMAKQFMNSSGYKDLSEGRNGVEGVKQEEFKKLYAQAKRAANAKLMQEFKGLNERVIDAKKSKDADKFNLDSPTQSSSSSSKSYNNLLDILK